MVISLKKINLPVLLVTALVIAVVLLAFKIFRLNVNNPEFMGGSIHLVNAQANSQSSTNDVVDSSRFQRPSNQPALNNNYAIIFIDKQQNNEPINFGTFKTSQDVIMAYFGILQEASNMSGYSGGCGTIGLSRIPYPYAYELLSSDQKKIMTLDQFKDSFKGIGHLTLLKLYPTYIPPGTPQNIQYNMIEAEVITGPSMDDSSGFKSGSHFAYFYGIVSTVLDEKAGWKIKAIDYFSEDFLCHPMHGWSYLANYFVQNVYGNWYHLINKIDKTEQNGNIISVYASGANKQYRFDFVRITNGDDELLHEMVNENGKWVETNLLKDRDQVLKLSILNPNLRQK